MHPELKKPRWSRAMHKHPTTETDRLDAMLNELERWTGALSKTDQALAKRVATKRYQAARKLNRNQLYGIDLSQYTVESETEYVGSELFCFRKLNLEVPLKWINEQKPDKSGDVGEGLQVRHTKYSTGRLLLHPDDVGWHTFFLVTGSFPTYRLAGWIKAKEGKVQENWRELIKGRFSYAVNQDFLHEMKDYELKGTKA